jgi:hypothetical protein
MSTSPFFLGAGFDPETIQTLDRAFDQACAALRGLRNAENIQEIIANEIVDRAVKASVIQIFSVSMRCRCLAFKTR